MCKWLRKFKRYVCKCFYPQIEYVPLINIEYEAEYIPIPMSPLSPEGGSDDNLACYD